MDFPIIRLKSLAIAWPWPFEERTETRLFARQGVETLEVTWEPGPPAIPCALHQREELLAFLRARAGLRGGGLVEFDVNGPLVVIVSKFPHEYAYEGELLWVFAESTYRAVFRSVEQGTHGMRECTVMMIHRDPGTWCCDLYDAALAGPAVRNRADDPEFDNDFPHHPIARVRTVLPILYQLTAFDEAPALYAFPSWRNRARAFAMLGQYREALGELGQVEEAVDLCLRGQVYLELGQPEDAARDLRESLLKDPQQPGLYRLLGDASLASGQPREAVVAYSQELNRSAGEELHLLRARALAEAGDAAEALRDVGECLLADPDRGDLYLERARVYRRLQQPRLALRDLSYALACDRGLVAAYLESAELLLELHLPQLALDRARHCLEEHRSSMEAYVLQARALAALSRPDKARAALMHALQLLRNPEPGQRERLEEELKRYPRGGR